MNLAEYQKRRDKIKDADVLMYKGKALISRIIRKVTKSEYSHAGIAVHWNNRLMVLEAVGRGVIVTPLSKNIESYYGDVHLYAASPGTILDRDRQLMVKFAQEELGKEYARWRMILFGFKIIFNKDLDKKDALKRASKLYCSHYVAQVYNAGDMI